MEDLFCTYTQALALKQLGFDEPCFGKYTSNRLLLSINWSNVWCENINESEIYAPLKQQVFKWFRDKYNIVHTVYSNASGYIWELHYNKERGGTHICDSEESGDCELSGMFTTYEGAESACIDKLISVIKEKKS